MKTNNNQYFAPECEEIRIRLEGCIALSPNEDNVTVDYHGFEDEQQW